MIRNFEHGEPHRIDGSKAVQASNIDWFMSFAASQFPHSSKAEFSTVLRGHVNFARFFLYKCLFAAVLLSNTSFADEIQRQRIRLQSEVLNVEISSTPEQRQKGLMYRMHLPEGAGMLFIYDKPEILSFWMKNTPLPLSIAFFDEHRRLINIAHMAPTRAPETEFYRSDKPALYALEVPQGWFERHNISSVSAFEFLD